MLLGCLEQTKLMVLFAKHELCSEKKYLSCAAYDGLKQLFPAVPAVRTRTSGMIELRWLLTIPVVTVLSHLCWVMIL